MGTLYIDRKALHVKLDGNALSFHSTSEREGTVPITPLKRVIFVGTVTVETNVLNRLASANISVLFLSGKSTRFRGMLHGTLHKNAILRVNQYAKSLDNDFPVIASIDIVRRKIEAQRELLLHAREKRPDCRLKLTSSLSVIEEILPQLEQEVPLESLRGFEGAASSQYFGAYTQLFPDSLDFTGRNRRPPEDPVNAILSLTYTIMHYEMVREIEVIGLDPCIGIYHQFEYGRESLACDLVEPFRPIVDRFVWEVFRNRTFTARDFAMNDERPGCYLKKESRKRYYPLYEDWAKGMRSLWIEEVRSLARRIMDGQDIVHQPDCET